MIKSNVIKRHPFDIICGEVPTTHDIREVIKRQYEFKRWLDDHCKGNYSMSDKLVMDGIHVSFQEVSDCAKFQKFVNNYWIHLHP